MKKLIIPICIAICTTTIVACGGDKQKPVTDSALTTAVDPAETVADAGTDKGKEIYNNTCKACHQENGQGLPKSFPPLAKSDFLGDRKAVIEQIINGKTGPMTVNGEEYNSAMPPQALNDQEIADVLTYVYSSWENTGDAFTAEEVKAVRDAVKK